MKKTISFVFSIVILITMSTTAFAAEDTTNRLTNLAQSTITHSQITQDTGAVVSTYENLDTFITEAKGQNPTLSDYDLAKFIIEYTGQDSAGIPEAEAIMMLEYDNINVSKSYAKVTEEGFFEITEQEALIAPLDVWQSSDGYLQLETGFSKTSTSGSTKRFNVWTIATWLKYPAICIEDALVLGTNGSFDDSYDEFGYVYQTFKCSSCRKESEYDRKVTRNDTIDDDLSLEYVSNGIPGIKFAPLAPRCDYCSGGAKDVYFRAFIRYGVLVEGSGSINAVYGHKTFGPIGISIGIDAYGVPNMSVPFGCTLKQYNARGVTLI